MVGMALRPCYLSQILIDEGSDEQLLFISEREGSRRMRIRVGINEAGAIDRAVKGQKFKRPLTHDLLVSMLEKLGATCREVRIVDARDNTFFAELLLTKGDGSELVVDCRPSDGIALMVRIPGVALLIAEDVLAEAGY
jgi:bifunctional DNase/RNase